MPNPEKEHRSFSKRELEILMLIAKENTNRQIAERLSISLNTVETHRGNMIKKVKAKNFYGVMMYAFKNKLIK
jgi:DNA-binding CsgD family transcriptional regulator